MVVQCAVCFIRDVIFWAKDFMTKPLVPSRFIDVVVGFFQETRRTNRWPEDMGPGE